MKKEVLKMYDFRGREVYFIPSKYKNLMEKCTKCGEGIGVFTNIKTSLQASSLYSKKA